MNLLNRLTIKARLTWMVFISLLVMLSVGITGIRGLTTTEESLETLYENRLKPTIEIGQISNLMRDNRIQLFAALQHAPDNPFTAMHDHPLTMHTRAVTDNIEEITQLWKTFSQRPIGEQGRALSERFQKSRSRFVAEGLVPARDALLQGEYRNSNEVILTRANPLFAQANKDFLALQGYMIENSQAMFTRAQGENAQTTTHTLALVVFGALLMGGMAYLVISRLNLGVTRLDQAMDALAAGDLTISADYTAQDELGQIITNFNRTVAGFRTTIAGFRNAASQLATAAEQTSAVTEQTNSAIAEQQCQTDQVATAMNQMNATVQEVAQNASQAAASAHNADGEAHAGREVVQQTIVAINQLATEVGNSAEVIRALQQDSERIGSVLGVIKSIAEQTNLLALNAAIEAARAGEQGRGFAVVADEVRTLASRTQSSTREIEAMIDTLQSGTRNAVTAMERSLGQSEQGVEQASHAGEALDAITRAISTINDMNTQIASASEQQSAVTEEINRNITTISQLAEQTAEGSLQTAASSEQLARLSEELQRAIGRFTI